LEDQTQIAIPLPRTHTGITARLRAMKKGTSITVADISAKRVSALANTLRRRKGFARARFVVRTMDDHSVSVYRVA
jgi:hypothetical protein